MASEYKLWRESPEEYCRVAGFTEGRTSMVSSMVTMVGPAQAHLRLAYSMLWKDSLPEPLVNLLNDDEDKIIQVWTVLCQTDTLITAEKVLRAARDLGFLSAPASSETDEVRFARAAQAFEAEERPTAWGSHPSEDVYSALMRQHGQYGEKILSPYTTLVGPSGIGKSFAIKQLALRHGLYVVYANLAPKSSQGYPRPVTMGVPPVAGSEMVGAWEIYLKNQIALSQCCKDLSLTAPGLLELLTSNRREVIEARTQLRDVFQKENGVVAASTIASALSSAKDLLEGLEMNRAPILSPCEDGDQRPVLVCFDEARSLLDDHDKSLFRALRQAATRLAAKKEYKRNGKPTFFLILLDTTSKISNFTPADVHDSSAKVSRQELLPPIHQISTLDVFAPPTLPDPTGSPEAVLKLFSCGRPLWGAFIHEASYSAEDLAVFATSKIRSPKTDAAAHASGIAVLSYRMRFYISSPALSEEMVASMMRYIVAVSKDRTTLLTTQPSEPVLAYAASCILQDPATRLSCIRAWISGLHSGAVNPGDVGEQVAALVLCFAFDHVACPNDNLPHAIAVQDLIKALFGSPVWDALEQKSTGATNALLENGTVFFNHFVRANKAPTLADLETAYRRGMAIFLPSNFPGMDVAIPVRMPAGENEKSRMGLLLVQVKNRAADAPTPGLKMHMDEDLRTAVAALGCAPHLDAIAGLVLCLRTHNEAQFCVLARKPAAAATTELLGIAFGLDTTVYPCLTAPAKPPPPPQGPAAKKKKTKTTASASTMPDMEEICSLLRRLLGSWPGAYADEDTASRYAQELLDPFYDGHGDDA